MIGLVNATLGLFLKTHYPAANFSDPGTLLVGHQCADADVCLDATVARFRGPRLLAGILGSDRAGADQYGVEVAGTGSGTRVGVESPTQYFWARATLNTSRQKLSRPRMDTDFHGSSFEQKLLHDSLRAISGFQLRAA